jgi:hypothetical protein
MNSRRRINGATVRAAADGDDQLSSGALCCVNGAAKMRFQTNNGAVHFLVEAAAH